MAEYYLTEVRGQMFVDGYEVPVSRKKKLLVAAVTVGDSEIRAHECMDEIYDATDITCKGSVKQNFEYILYDSTNDLDIEDTWWKCNVREVVNIGRKGDRFKNITHRFLVNGLTSKEVSAAIEEWKEEHGCVDWEISGLTKSTIDYVYEIREESDE